MGLKALRQVKILSPRALTVSVILTSALFIFSPMIKRESVIEIPPDRLVFEVQNTFSNLSLTFAETVSVRGGNSTPVGNWGEGKPHGLPIAGETSAVSITNVFFGTTNETVRFTLLFRAVEPVSLASVTMDGKITSLKDFEPYIRGDKRYRRHRVMREGLAEIVREFNDPLSNFVITAMTFSLFPLVGLVGRLAYRFYLVSEARMRAKVHLALQKADQDLETFSNDEADQFMSRRRFYLFLQVVGPALGFFFTISSLIAGLDPRADLANDATQLFGSLHIAMVSTALGLAIRILATWAERLDLELSLRKDRLLVSNMPELAERGEV